MQRSWSASQRHLEEAPPWQAEQGSCSKRNRTGVTLRCPQRREAAGSGTGYHTVRTTAGTRRERPGDRPHRHRAAHEASVTAQAEYTTYSHGTRWPRLKEKRVGAFSGGCGGWGDDTLRLPKQLLSARQGAPEGPEAVPWPVGRSRPACPPTQAQSLSGSSPGGTLDRAWRHHGRSDMSTAVRGPEKHEDSSEKCCRRPQQRSHMEGCTDPVTARSPSLRARNGFHWDTWHAPQHSDPLPRPPAQNRKVGPHQGQEASRGTSMPTARANVAWTPASSPGA